MNIAIISFQDNADIIGAKYVHAYLKTKNHRSFLVLQPNNNPSADSSLFKFIADYNIEVVGISLMSYDFYRACCFSKIFKKQFPDIPLVFGGVHATIAPEECLEVCDIVIRGEGEVTFSELIKRLECKLDYSDLEGICYREEGNYVINPLRPLVKNIDSLPFPGHLPDDYYIVIRDMVRKMNKKIFGNYSRFDGKFPNILTTRGCNLSCAYCWNSALKGLYDCHMVRRRSVESVMNEITEILSEHPDCFSLNIQDDCFLTNDIGWISEFARQYRYRAGLPFRILATPSNISKEKLSILMEAGLIIVMVGLQSGSERVNREVFKRPVSNDVFLKAAHIIHDLNLSVVYDIIVDNPYETEEDILKTIDVILHIPQPFQLQMFSLGFYQGTELYKRAVKDGIAFIDPKAHNAFRRSSSLLNKIIFMIPTFPISWIRYFIMKRKSINGKMLVHFSAILTLLFLYPISNFKIMYRGYGSNLTLTLRLIWPFRKLILRKVLQK